MNCARFFEQKVIARVEKISTRARVIAFLLNLAVMLPALSFFMNYFKNHFMGHFMNQSGQSMLEGPSTLGWIAGMVCVPLGWVAWVLILSFIPKDVFSSVPSHTNPLGMQHKEQYIRGKIVLALTVICAVILAACVMWSIVLL